MTLSEARDALKRDEVVQPALPGLADASEAPAITAGLLARGATEEETRGLLGENWLRVWRQVLR